MAIKSCKYLITRMLREKFDHYIKINSYDSITDNFGSSSEMVQLH